MRLKFNIEITLFVILFAITNYSSFYLFFEKDLVLTPILLFALSLLLILILIKRLKILTIALNSFFDSIKFSDDNLKYGLEKKGSIFKKLSESLESVKNDFIKEKIEKEKNIQFLNLIINELNSGVLVISKELKIIFKNKYLNNLIINNKYLKDEDTSVLNKLIINNKQGKYQENISVNGKLQKHSIIIKEIFIENDNYKIVIIENIEKQQNETQQKAWENIIRVLTHEIMNSMTPINSLAQTAKTILDSDGLNESDKLDLNESLDTIISRSNGLKEFISSYRNLTLLPDPVPSEIMVDNLFNNI